MVMDARFPQTQKSEVKTIAVTIGATSATKATALTPTADTKVRIISVVYREER
jgi:hypothetical protein|tara:strand:- start:329 stop:487 length:159 start_codon:yes stop_codon:yes gene_type:complete